MMTRVTRRPPNPRRGRSKPARQTPAAIPERGLKIGEAARILGVETYVLRFWETQFPFLKPAHSKTKHRFYHQRDLDVLSLIQRLLHDEGFTIAGANKYIKEKGLATLLAGAPRAETEHPPAAAPPQPAAAPEAGPQGAAREVLAEVRRDLESLHKLLEE
ncbi:MAG TPA: MerR family transcriptional regulator [Candidatus Binataceae bacterium]|nr:MerR family transcriptional regulator [Candidatus Binataceae bacterium]